MITWNHRFITLAKGTQNATKIYANSVFQQAPTLFNVQTLCAAFVVSHIRQTAGSDLALVLYSKLLIFYGCDALGMTLQ